MFELCICDVNLFLFIYFYNCVGLLTFILHIVSKFPTLVKKSLEVLVSRCAAV